MYISINCMIVNRTDSEYNCTNVNHEQIIINYFLPIVCVSFVGVILNSLCVFIFKFSKNMEATFLILLRHYSFNSLLFNLNDIMGLFLDLWFTSYSNKYWIYFTENYSFALYFTHIYQNIWAILYTYAGILDIFIVYERILQYKPTVDFMRKQKAITISLYVLIFSIIINIPVIYTRETKEYLLQLDDEEMRVYRHGTRDFDDNIMIIILIYLANFVRDIIICIIEITVNIYLILSLFAYLENKQHLSNRAYNKNQINGNNIIIFRKTHINNSRIAMFIYLRSSYF